MGQRSALDPGAVNAAARLARDPHHGRSPAHGAYPHLGRDPILALAQVVVGAARLVGRRIDPLHPAVVNVGAARRRAPANVIPPYARRARVAARASTRSDRLTLREAASRLIEATSPRARLPRPRSTIEPGEPLLANDPEITARVRALLPRGRASRSPPPWRSCGSDDFGFFGAVAPLAMAFVGLDGAQGFSARPLHHPELLPPEAAVSAVARTLAMAYLGASAADRLTRVEASVVPRRRARAPRARARSRRRRDARPAASEARRPASCPCARAPRRRARSAAGALRAARAWRTCR